MKAPRKPALIFLFVLCLGIGFFFTAQSAAEKAVQKTLLDFGFPDAKTGSVQIGLKSVTARNITLDAFGFSTIETLQAFIFWPSFLLSQNVTALHLGGVSVTSQEKRSGTLQFLSGTLNSTGLPNIPYDAFSLRRGRIDFDTPYGNIRIEGDVDIAPKDTQTKTIQARIHARQFQLTFDSLWSGTLTENGDLALDGHIEDTKINAGPFRFSRAAGWLGVTAKAGQDTALSGQFEAGSGSFFDVPVQNINLIADGTKDRPNMTFRASASGLKEVRLTADLASTGEDPHFNAVLDIPDIKAFLSYIETLQKDKKTKTYKTLSDMGGVKIEADFLPERRFAEGPFPFALKASHEAGAFLTGLFLIYPESMDIRGSAEAEKQAARDVAALTGLPDEQVSGGVLRLDGNLKKLLNPAPSRP
jgi:hypothetical protein